MSECQGCEVTDRSAVAVFVCASCPHGRGLVKCTLSGSPIVEQVCGGVLKAKAGFACPLGKGPDESGLVRFWRVRWRGVPFPLKLRLRFGWRRLGAPAPARWEDMPGCGCIHVLKAAWENVPDLVGAFGRFRPARGTV